MVRRTTIWGILMLVLLFASAPAAADHVLTAQVSTGANGAVDVEEKALVSADGSHVFFGTRESLQPSDSDSYLDVYDYSGGVATLASAGGNGAFDAVLKGKSADGSRVFFETAEQLVAADSDSSVDVYERAGGVTTRVSSGNNAWDARFEAASDDGTHVVFRTQEPLAPTDTNSTNDLYENVGGTVQHVSAGTNGGTSRILITRDGSHITFKASGNVWQRTGGVTTKVTTLNENSGCVCSFEPQLGGTSADGTQVFFVSRAVYAAGAGDLCGFDVNEDPFGCEDLFKWTAGTYELMSPGPDSGGNYTYFGFEGVSADGSHVFYGTDEWHTAEDQDDGVWDTYERFNGQTKLITTGPTDPHTSFTTEPGLAFASPDGLTVVTGTDDPWVAEDTDSANDMYEYSHGVMRLASVGPNGETGAGTITGFAGASEDGSRIFFRTTDALSPADTDSADDVYERVGGRTTAVLQTGAPATTLAGLSRDGRVAVLLTAEQLLPSDTDAKWDLYLYRAPSGYARPRGATPVFASLVPAYAACTSPNHQHGPPLSFGSCGAPQTASSQLTVGTPDANGQSAKSSGSVGLYALVGDPATPADEADVGIGVDISDVRLASGLSDYTGTLEARLGLRITDRAGGEPVTLTDTPLPVTVPCTATTDTTIGSRCTVSTTADAVVPGSVPERARSIWALDQVRVYDGNGSLFAVQGLFVP